MVEREENPYAATAAAGSEERPIEHTIQSVGLMLGTALFVVIFLVTVSWVRAAMSPLVEASSSLSWWRGFAASHYPITILCLLLGATFVAELVVRSRGLRRAFNYGVVLLVLVFSLSVMLALCLPF